MRPVAHQDLEPSVITAVRWRATRVFTCPSLKLASDRPKVFTNSFCGSDLSREQFIFWNTSSVYYISYFFSIFHTLVDSIYLLPGLWSSQQFSFLPKLLLNQISILRPINFTFHPWTVVRKFPKTIFAFTNISVFIPFIGKLTLKQTLFICSFSYSFDSDYFVVLWHQLLPFFMGVLSCDHFLHLPFFLYLNSEKKMLQVNFPFV